MSILITILLVIFLGYLIAKFWFELYLIWAFIQLVFVIIVTSAITAFIWQLIFDSPNFKHIWLIHLIIIAGLWVVKLIITYREFLLEVSIIRWIFRIKD